MATVNPSANGPMPVWASRGASGGASAGGPVRGTGPALLTSGSKLGNAGKTSPQARAALATPPRASAGAARPTLGKPVKTPAPSSPTPQPAIPPSATPTRSPASPPPEAKLGDLNGDGIVGSADGQMLLSYLFGGGEAPVSSELADVNGDGVVDIADATQMFAQEVVDAPAPPPSPGVGPPR